MTWFVTLPFLTTLILPCHGSFFFTQGGKFRPGGRLVRRERAAERLVDVRHVAVRVDPELAGTVDLHLPLVRDSLTTAVEPHIASGGQLVRIVDHAWQRVLECGADPTSRLRQADNERMRAAVVVERERVLGRDRRAVRLRHGRPVHVRRPGLEARSDPEAADVRIRMVILLFIQTLPKC